MEAKTKEIETETHLRSLADRETVSREPQGKRVVGSPRDHSVHVGRIVVREQESRKWERIYL